MARETARRNFGVGVAVALEGDSSDFERGARVVVCLVAQGNRLGSVTNRA